MKQHIGMAAVVTGIVGAMFGVGGIENSIEFTDMIASIGVAVTSCMLLYVGTLLVKEEI